MFKSHGVAATVCSRLHLLQVLVMAPELSSWVPLQNVLSWVALGLDLGLANDELHVSASLIAIQW